jgi:hypothetical protein
VKYEIIESLVLLCEGDADANFFNEMLKRRTAIPRFSIISVRGKDKFEELLDGIRADRARFRTLRGVLLAADSGDSPATTFNSMRAQITAAGGYGVPTQTLQVARGAADHPALAVMLIPDEQNPGGLETLYLQEMAPKFPWVTACIDTFLACGPGNASRFPPEKRDKAKFASLVAVTNQDDPSRAASWVYRDPSLVTVTAACFNDVERRLNAFAAAV